MFFSLPKSRAHARAQPPSRLNHRGNHRRRLQKPRPNQQSIRSIYSCKDATDLVKLQTCLDLVSSLIEKDNDVKVQPLRPMQSRGDKNHLKESVGYESDDFMSLYTPAAVEEMDMKRRRYLKTPVFAIGQLERKSPHYPVKANAESLAKVYQNLLPSPPITPPPNFPRMNSKTERIRRMKSQHGLRDHISSQLRTSAWTETETLCRQDFEPVQDNRLSDLTCSEQNIGLQLCLDLLTRELVGAFFHQHPQEHQDRASKLQIQLMIEVYEDILQKMKRDPETLHVTGLPRADLMATEKILHHWLEVLYYLFDLADGLDLTSI